MLISIALPVPLYKNFDYLPNTPSNSPLSGGGLKAGNQKKSHALNSPNSPSHSPTNQPKIGSRVQVPFGNQTLIGIIVGYTNEADCQVPLNKLRAIKKVIDDEPIFDKQMMSFAHWLSTYYHYPLGEVFMVMLPSFISQGKALDIFTSHWKVAKNASIDDISKSAHRQREQFNIIQLNGQHGASEDVLIMEGVERQYLKKLSEKGLIEHFTEERKPPKPISLAKLPHSLNDEQTLAVTQIIKAIDTKLYKGFLLNGVTGSGKTEVYLQAMQPVLEAGKQVLILVPEIGLTPQTKARFSQRFSANILLLHSGLSNSARMQGWEDCRGNGEEGYAQIVIGTRSALLYPFAKLGMIIVDEAHDQSYKQQDSLRYQASDVALYRGFQSDIPVILGTATPTLEQFKLVSDGKLTELTLINRAGYAKPPALQLVDARKPDANSQHATRTTYSTQADGKEQDTGLTPEVITDIGNTLAKGEQVLVFLNRRGYAPILLCGACGWQADCPNCDSHLTVHRVATNSNHSQYLKCHHCGYQSSMLRQCPDCHSHNLDPVGTGTTRLTDSLHAIFANPQTSKKIYPVIQIDHDTTRRKGSWERIYEQINRGEPAILVGTQMIAKGHHFPKVTLVVMPNADRGFLSADFRSPEHTAQLIMQVAGRAGRGSHSGRVLIQTVQPDNPLLLSLVRDGYQKFAQQLIQERQMMGLPPFVHACLVRCEGKALDKTHEALQQAINILPKPNNLAISGVIDAPMVKKNGRYHSQIFILSRQRSHLHQILNYWWEQVLNLSTSKGLKLTLDIDPVGW